MIKKVCFVRHGQTDDNIAPVFQRYDSQLSDAGVQQAYVLAQRVKDYPIDTLISSVQDRAMHTARIISNEIVCDVDTSPLLVERIKPNSIEGKLHDDEEASRIAHLWYESIIGEGPKVLDGETYDEIIGRCDDVMRYLESSKGDMLLVVSHGFFIRSFVARAIFGLSLDVNLFRIWHTGASIYNTSITVMEAHPCSGDQCGNFSWKLVSYNDHSHIYR